MKLSDCKKIVPCLPDLLVLICLPYRGPINEFLDLLQYSVVFGILDFLVENFGILGVDFLVQDFLLREVATFGRLEIDFLVDFLQGNFYLLKSFTCRSCTPF